MKKVHDEYGKKLFEKVAGGDFMSKGDSVEVDYGTERPARIDGTVGNSIAVEIESRTAKQIRGAVMDLLCHEYPKKLLVIFPTGKKSRKATKQQCETILKKYLPKGSKSKVVVTKGHGNDEREKDDEKIIKQALKDLGYP